MHYLLPAYRLRAFGSRYQVRPQGAGIPRIHVFMYSCIREWLSVRKGRQVKMAQVEFDLFISRDEYLKHYQTSGQAQVIVRAVDGRKVQFPASILQRFVLHEGVRGRFVIRFDPQGRFQAIERLR